MSLFNLQSYCQQNDLEPALVRCWLLMNLRKYTFETMEDVSDGEFLEIEEQIILGNKYDFKLSKTNNPQKAFTFIQFLIRKASLHTLTEDLKFNIRVLKEAQLGITSQISQLDSQLLILSKLKSEMQKFEFNRLSLEKSKLLLYLESKRTHLNELMEINALEKRARFNAKFYQIAKEKLLREFPDLIPLRIKTPQKSGLSFLNSSHNKKKSEILETHFPREDDSTIHLSGTKSTALIPWDDVIFGDSYILVRHNRKMFNRISLYQSRKSFNSVKQMYEHRNIAPLEIEYAGNTVTKIVNLELLTFLFLFFDQSGTDFKTKDLRLILKSSKDYTKVFYKKYLKDFFTSRCFSYLIEKADEYSPIIPLPERVVHSSGNETIHESFLFPIRKVSCYFWIWESVEEKKATYVFKTSSGDYTDEIQRIYDFISGGFQNKRMTLLRNLLDSCQIDLVKRIKHNDFDAWRKGIQDLIILDA